MSTQNLQSAESRKINKSFFEGQSRVRYLTWDFFACRRESEDGGEETAPAYLSLSLSSAITFPICHVRDLTASPPLVILAQVIHKILKVRYKCHD